MLKGGVQEKHVSAQHKTFSNRSPIPSLYSVLGRSRAMHAVLNSKARL